MAKAFLRAAEIADIAKAEIARIEKERDAAVEAAIKAKVGIPVLRGRLWWKRIHLQTRAEAEDIFNGVGDWYIASEAYFLRGRYECRIGTMKKIESAALGAIERGDSTVLLDHDEIAAIRAASTEPVAA